MCCEFRDSRNVEPTWKTRSLVEQLMKRWKTRSLQCRLVLCSSSMKADRLLGDAEGVPAQYRPSAEELTKECKKAVEILRDAPKAHPSVESLETALSAAENMIPVLEERANNWDEFVRVRDEADVELDKLRQPLDEVLAKPRRPISEAKHDFDVISVERQKSDILAGKVRRLQELSEMLDPLESAYADVRFIDVDAEQTESSTTMC